MMIMDKIRKKIAQKLREQIGKELGDDIIEALKDQEIDKQIKSLITQKKLTIVDDEGQGVYNKAIDHVAETGEDLDIADSPVRMSIKKAKTTFSDEGKQMDKTRTHLVREWWC